jgi:hypothetical protein
MTVRWPREDGPPPEPVFAIGSLLSQVAARASRRVAVSAGYGYVYPPAYPPTRTPGDW